MHPANPQTRFQLSSRLALLAAPVAAGLLACGALLGGLGGPVPSALAAPAGATRNYPGPFPCNTTLQLCIDGSSAGDTILVQAGTYTESLLLSTAVSLTGVSSATAILHAPPSQRVLTAIGSAVNSSVVISGLAFTGGHVTGTLVCAASCGGAILITGTAAPRLTNLDIRDNSASNQGGGLYAYNSSALVLSGVVVRDNVSVNHGGGASLSGAVTLNDSLFENNQCTDVSCQAGGLQVIGALAANNTRFLSNTSAAQAGGAYVLGTMVLAGDLFQNNQCTQFLCVAGGADALFDTVVTGTQFISNAAGPLGAGGSGGGMVAFGPLTVTNSFFEDNQALNGGGLYIYSLRARLVNTLLGDNHATINGQEINFNSASGALSLLHATLAGVASGDGAAIYVTAGQAGITDTLISSATIGIERASGTVHEDYNLFSGVGNPFTGTVIHGGHSLTGTAGFVNAAADNYHLSPSSAAIDKGIDAGINFDIDGDHRPSGAGFDIGFDEYVAAAIKLYLPLVER
jgi:hypothetical protein